MPAALGETMMEPEYVTWMDGTTEMRHVSARYRHALLIDYAERFNLQVFVETGTCAGDTLAAMLMHFDRLYSIELSDYYYNIASERFLGNPTVKLIHGNSAEMLPALFGYKGFPRDGILFWLDAHAAGEKTAQGPSPLLEELKAILDSKIRGVILADDMNPGELTEKAIWLVELYPHCKQEWKDQILRVNLLP
jgi:hypothetical protein